MSKNLTALARSALQIGGAILATSGILDANTTAAVGNVIVASQGHINTATGIQLAAGIVSAVAGLIWGQKRATQTNNVETALSQVGVSVEQAKAAPMVAVSAAIADPTTLVSPVPVNSAGKPT